MAHVVSITDTNSTITLTSGDYFLTGFVPSRPRLRDGVYQDVAETIELFIDASSTTAAQDAVNDIEKMLSKALARSKTKIGYEVYLQLQMDGEAGAWRSPILNGEVEVSADAMRAWVGGKIPVRVHVLRKFYWEDTTIRTAGSGTVANNGGVIALSSSAVDGTEETPAIVQIANSSGSGKTYRNFHISNLVADAPGNFSHFNTSSSAWSVTAGTTSHEDYTINANTCIEGQGRLCNVISSITGVSSSDTVMASLTVLDSTALVTLYSTDEVELPANSLTVNLGAVPIPPGGDYGSWSEITLRISLRSVGTTVASGNVQFVMLAPNERYRFLYQRGLTTPNGGTLTDDGVEEITHNAGYSLYRTRGDFVTLLPGHPQRLLFVHDTGSGWSSSSNTSVTIQYRPRRLSV